MKSSIARVTFVVALGFAVLSLFSYSSLTKRGFITQYSLIHSVAEASAVSSDKSFFLELARQAEMRTLSNVRYDGRYMNIDYPMGDVPKDIGVCTDVVIRTYRALGIDLQEKVHVDMSEHFVSYPKIWGLLKPDANIDHRRVPNLMTFFNRMGASLEISDLPGDYSPGDVVSWDLGGGTMHIGIVSSKKSDVSGNPLIVHNIGAGPKLDDMLFEYTIIGHYRYGNLSDLTDASE